MSLLFAGLGARPGLRCRGRADYLARMAGPNTADPWGNKHIAFAAKHRIDRSEFTPKSNQAPEAGGVLVGDRMSQNTQAARGARAGHNASFERRSKSEAVQQPAFFAGVDVDLEGHTTI